MVSETLKEESRLQKILNTKGLLQTVKLLQQNTLRTIKAINKKKNIT